LGITSRVVKRTVKSKAGKVVDDSVDKGLGDESDDSIVPDDRRVEDRGRRKPKPARKAVRKAVI